MSFQDNQERQNIFANVCRLTTLPVTLKQSAAAISHFDQQKVSPKGTSE